MLLSRLVKIFKLLLYIFILSILLYWFSHLGFSSSIFPSFFLISFIGSSEVAQIELNCLSLQIYVTLLISSRKYHISFIASQIVSLYVYNVGAVYWGNTREEKDTVKQRKGGFWTAEIGRNRKEENQRRKGKNFMCRRLSWWMWFKNTLQMLSPLELYDFFKNCMILLGVNWGSRLNF